MAVRPRRTRTLGNVFILLGLIILMAVGFFVIREGLRRREVLAEMQAAEAAAAATATTLASIPTATSTGTATTTATATTTFTPVPSATATPPPSATPSPTATATPTATAVPSRIVRIMAPAIGLDSKVIEVGWKVVTEKGKQVSVWEIAAYAAGHHKNSAVPGQGGNIVISGHHNIEGEVFKRVVDLEPGDEITLQTEDGRSYLFQVKEKNIVQEVGASAEQRALNAKAIEATEDERLTLVTCWPYWTNTHRVIVVAQPVIG